MQRLGVARFIVAFVHIIFPLIVAKKKEIRLRARAGVNYYCKIAIFMLFPIANILLSKLLKAPGTKRGYLGPGTCENEGECSLNYPGGANSYIDRILKLGPYIFQRDGNCKFIFGCSDFDKDGNLGTLNFIFGVALGSLAADFFIKKRHKILKLSKRFLSYIFASIVIAMILGGLPIYKFIPINSQMWSFSFVCISNALSLVLFSLIGLLSLKGFWDGFPFIFIN